MCVAPKTLTGLFIVCLYTLISVWPSVAPAEPALASPLRQAQGNALKQLNGVLHRLKAEPQRHALLDELSAIQGELLQQDSTASAEFAEVEAQIQARHLPPGLLERHKNAVAQYRQAVDGLQIKLSETVAARTPSERAARAGELLERLDTLQPARRVPADTAHLPFNTPAPLPVPEEQASAGDGLPQSVQVASTLLLPGLLALAAPEVADLALGQGAISDTPDIRALAQSLEHHPVKIYQWVRDNIVFTPTYGAVQSAETTLLERRGNAVDTASLLIALLRASGIHARYAYGDVIIPVNKVLNWLGTDSAEAAQDLLSQAGVPITLRTQGGKIIAFKFRNHVWAEAWIDFYPSRGANPSAGSGTGQGDTWLPLDASFKQYLDLPGTDLSRAVPFDVESFRTQLLSAMQGNADWASNVDMGYIESRLSDYQAQLSAYSDTHPVSRAERRILSENRIVLAAGLPYQVAQRLGQYTLLPASFSNTFTLALYADATAQNLDNPVFSRIFELSELDMKRLHLGYEPATADRAIQFSREWRN